MNCPACTTPIPANAKFCPKCGKPSAEGSLELPRAAGALPSTGPIPRAGKLFIAATLVGLVLIISGVAMRFPILLFAGLGVLALVTIVGLIGHHVS